MIGFDNMKRTTLPVIATIIALSIASCMGATARLETLLPAVQIAWAHVEEDVRKAFPDSSPIVDGLDDAIESGDIERLKKLPLIAIETFAIEAIVIRVIDGDIAPIVGKLLKQRIEVFFRALRELTR